MGLGCVRLSEDEVEEKVPVLKKLYQFESDKLSGPNSNNRDIRDVLWSKEELFDSYNFTDGEIESLEDILKELSEKKQIMKIKDDGVTKYISRVAETVRLLGHTYEYWPSSLPCVEAVRWRIEDKEIPKRTIPLDEFLEKIEEALQNSIDYDMDTLMSVIKDVVEGIGRYINDSNEIDDIRFSEFQLDAAIEGIKGEFSESYQIDNQILAAGVGSGKTIAFAIPMFVSAIVNSKDPSRDTDMQLLLYPRTALAKDQYEKLKEMSSKIKNKGVFFDVHLEHYTYYDRIDESVKQGVRKKFSDSQRHPQIIVTTLETLKRRIHRSSFISHISDHLRRVIIDEIHLISGMTGMNTVKLLDRLKVLCKNEILWIGSSATVAAPSSHASKIFDVDESRINLLTPDKEELKSVGISHHVFMRRRPGISSMGTLVNATSLLLHNRRDRLDERESGLHQKMVAFGDSLDLLGRWNSDFRENERTENEWVPDSRYVPKTDFRKRLHPQSSDREEWDDRQRELPYALRFHKPLQRRINIEVEGPTGEYENVYDDYKNTNICELCREGQEVLLGEFSSEQMKKLGELVYRDPNKDGDYIQRFSISHHPIFKKESMMVGSLHRCPYLIAGACSWFPDEDLGVERIPTTNLWEWANIGRSRIYSSKTKDVQSGEIGDDLSSIVFSAPVPEVYDVGDEENEINLDLVFASPSLEVGIDITDVTETIMHKAIRNISSYRQKVGRAGREVGSDTLNVTLLSERPIDLHYYRQPRKLIRYANLEPIPLKDYNPAVRSQGVYMGVWDYLSLRGVLPEAIPTGRTSSGEFTFTKRLKLCVKMLEKEEDDIRKHLHAISRGRIDRYSQKVTDAISEVKDQIDILLMEIDDMVEAKGFDHLSDIIVNTLNPIKPIRLDSDVSGYYKKINDFEDLFVKSRVNVNPLKIEMEKEFAELDKMKRCGWDAERLEKILKDIEEKLSDFDDPSQEEHLEDVNYSLNRIKKYLNKCKSKNVDPIALFFFKQFKNFAKTNSPKCHYLSYIFEEIPVLEIYQRNPYFTRLSNLFSNPYEKSVVLDYEDGQDGRDETIPMSESLYRTVPGTWTYHLGKTPHKTKSGSLKAYDEGRILEMNLDNITGSSFGRITTSIPEPPDAGEGTIDVYRPEELVMMSTQKRVPLSKDRMRIADGDEDERENADKRIDIPKSYNHGWTHVQSIEGEKVKVKDILSDSISLEGTEKNWRDVLKHPLMGEGLIEDIYWHEKLNVIEYDYGVKRNYSANVEPVEIQFIEDADRVGLGRRIETEGISFELSREIVEEILEDLKEKIKKGNDIWRPSFLKAFKSSLSNHSFEDGFEFNYFSLKDFMDFLIYTLYPELEIGTESLKEHLESLLSEEGDLEDKAISYLEDLPKDTDIDDIEEKIKGLKKNIQRVYEEIDEIIPDFEDWVIKTLLNTFAIKSLHAAQELCGVSSGEMGYGLDLEGIGDRYRVFLYDKTEGGNGSCKVIKDNLYILNLQREKSDTLLPTNDFLSLLEENLLQCSQFHTDLNALKKRKSSGIDGMEYIEDESEEVKRISKDVWDKLDIHNTTDAWKLPLIGEGSRSIAGKEDIEEDDLIRAANICWTGCPECTIDNENIMGARGEYFLDKLVLNHWFDLGTKRVDEYRRVNPEDLGLGESDLRIGNMTDLTLVDDENRKIRSVTLPYTIGFELTRSEDPPDTKILIREDDMKGNKKSEDFYKSAHGINSVGFRRLIWFQLLTSAYLEALGAIPEDRKKVDLIFYDCRDIILDDPYLSDRMLETIEPYRKRYSSERIRKLSDVLRWLHESGFSIRILVDERRLKEEGVSKLIKRLRGLEDIKTMTKSLKSVEGFGNMHAKALKTPIGILQGSANLTLSGTEGNVEITSHHLYGGHGYEQLETRMGDIFYGAKEIDES